MTIMKKTMRNKLMAVLAFGVICVLAWTASDVKAGAKESPSLPAPAGEMMVIPVAGVVRAQLHGNFDEARGGHVHQAIDILAPRGTPVLAAVDGTVRKFFTSRAGGLTIYETDPREETIYYYAHLDRYAPNLREGMPLRHGDVIGYVGSSGNAPAGTPHLHFAIQRLPSTKEWWKGVAIDPYPILMARGITVGGGAVGEEAVGQK
jgi:murein DD-endopeptidase MepM/ murein hydrolase activator NlpD